LIFPLQPLLAASTGGGHARDVAEIVQITSQCEREFAKAQKIFQPRLARERLLRRKR
jgi:hypothetical protein